MSPFGVRRDKAELSSGCKSHPANSLQPEATGAVMEVTVPPVVQSAGFQSRLSSRELRRTGNEQPGIELFIFGTILYFRI